MFEPDLQYLLDRDFMQRVICNACHHAVYLDPQEALFIFPANTKLKRIEKMLKCSSCGGKDFFTDVSLRKMFVTSVGMRMKRKGFFWIPDPDKQMIDLPRGPNPYTCVT